MACTTITIFLVTSSESYVVVPTMNKLMHAQKIAISNAASKCMLRHCYTHEQSGADFNETAEDISYALHQSVGANLLFFLVFHTVQMQAP